MPPAAPPAVLALQPSGMHGAHMWASVAAVLLQEMVTERQFAPPFSSPIVLINIMTLNQPSASVDAKQHCAALAG